MKRIRDKFDISTIGLDPKTAEVFASEIDSILTFSRHITALESELERFEAVLAKHFEKNEFLDLELARHLAAAASHLLTHIKTSPWADEVPFVLAAVRYLLNATDSQNDFTSIDGFDDDARVIQSVITKFNLSHVCTIQERK